MSLLEQAEKFAQSIKTSEEYVAFKDALAEIVNDEDANLKLNELKKLQFEIKNAHSLGQVPDAKKVKKMQDVYHECILIPQIAKFLNVEYNYLGTIEQVQMIIASVIQED